MARDFFRNSTKLEDMHAADQIDDQEMQTLMIDVVDRCYDFLMDLCSPHGAKIIDDLKLHDELPEWNDPEPMMRRHLWPVTGACCDLGLNVSPLRSSPTPLADRR